MKGARSKRTRPSICRRRFSTKISINETPLLSKEGCPKGGVVERLISLPRDFLFQILLTLKLFRQQVFALSRIFPVSQIFH